MEEVEEDDHFDTEWEKPQDFEDKSPNREFRCRKIDTLMTDTGHPKVILHIDIDCFYAQVEMIRNPALRNKPLGIQQKYIVVTCNYLAREYGVTKLMLIKDAKEKCPSLVLVSGEDLTHYRQMSYKISEYLQQYCPRVERLGFDENFLDITELVNHRLANQNKGNQEGVTGHVYGEEPTVLDSCSCGCHERLRVGSHIAADIREGLYKELGITCCGGIAHNKLLSKLVAGSHKPNQQTTLFPESTGSLMGSLKSVRNIPGIGHSSSKQLQELGVISVRDLQAAELSLLKRDFGETAAVHMKQLANGIDESPVVAFSLPQTMSDEDSFKKCSSVREAENKIKELIDNLLKRLIEDGRTPSTLRLTVRKMLPGVKYPGRESRQCPIPNTVFSNFTQERISQTSGQLQVLAMVLFNKLINTKEPFHLTLINVAFAKMEEKSRNSITNFFSKKSKMHPDIKDFVQTEKDSSQSVGPDDIKEEASQMVKSLSSGHERVEPGREQLVRKNVKLKGKNSEKNVDSRISLTKWLSSGKKDYKEESETLASRSKCNDGDHAVTSAMHPDKSEKTIDNTEAYKEYQHIDKAVKSEVILNRCESDKIPGHKRKNSEGGIVQNTGLDSRVEAKRLKLTENFDNLIPGHVDKDMFYQLPPAIQQEILTSTRLTNSCLDCTSSGELGTAQTVEDADKTENRNLDISNTLYPDIPEKACLDISKQGETAFSDNKTETVTKHITNTIKSPSGGFFKSKAMNRSGMKTDPWHTDGPHNFVIDKKNNHVNDTKSTHATRHEKCEPRAACSGEPLPSTSEDNSHHKPDTFIPPDIDRETFTNLPSDIQQELLIEWKKKEFTKTKQVIPIKPPHFKMPQKSSDNTIMSYFPKANK